MFSSFFEEVRVPHIRLKADYAVEDIVIEAPCGSVTDREKVKKYMKSHKLALLARALVSFLPSCHIATKACGFRQLDCAQGFIRLWLLPRLGVPCTSGLRVFTRGRNFSLLLITSNSTAGIPLKGSHTFTLNSLGWSRETPI